MGSHEVSPATCRSGMTLVELLVVIVIMSVLLVTVIPVLSPSDDQKGREAASTVAGMVSRVLGRAQTNGDRGAGLWIEPAIKAGTVQSVSGSTWVLDNVGQPLAMAGIDLFTSEPQDDYLGDDPEQAVVHVNRNTRSSSRPGDLEFPGPYGPIDPSFTTINGGIDAVLTFSVTTSPFIRELCGKSSRIRIPRDSANEFYLRLFTASEQNSLPHKMLPRPYRPCNAGNIKNDSSPPQPHSDWQNPDRNPGDDGEQRNKFYDQSADGDRINFSTESFISGMIRVIPGKASLPDEPPVFDPGRRAIGTVTATPPTNYPGIQSGYPFAIIRPNTRSPTPPLSLPAGYAIDVLWSSYGTLLLRNSLHRSPNDGTAGMGAINDLLANEPIQIMFDKDGRLTSIQYRKYLLGFGVGAGSVVDDTLALTSDLYLLVGRADRVGLPYNPSPTEDNPGANWQYPDSRWVKISRTTGRTIIADPMLYLQQGNLMVSASTVFQSQAFARDDVPASRN
jgi:prepilin-type N-terminal cleavage/methylation domain-containing protein